MNKTIEVKARRDDMLVGTLESDSPLVQAFPKASVVVLKPNGSDARSDMELGTLRREWAEHMKTKADGFKSPGTVQVEINPLGTVGALLERMAAALGLPAAALALRLPDRSTVNPKSKVASFFKAWGE
jgi:hypothetical protein